MAASLLIRSRNFSASVVAATGGTTQALSNQLLSEYNIVTSATAANYGVILRPSSRTTIVNRSGVTIRIYPPAGAKIETGATNAAITLATGAQISFVPSSATQFYQVG